MTLKFPENDELMTLIKQRFNCRSKTITEGRNKHTFISYTHFTISNKAFEAWYEENKLTKILKRKMMIWDGNKFILDKIEETFMEFYCTEKQNEHIKQLLEGLK